MDDDNEESYLSLAIVLIGVASLIMSGLRLDILWMIVSVFYLGLMYGVYKIEVLEKDRYKFYLLKKNLFLWTFLPLLLGASGFARVIDFYFIFRSIFFAIVVSILSFMVILNLDHHTSFRPNFSFTIIFMVLFTIASAIILEISRFISDQLLGTEMLEGNLHFMSDLVWITIFSTCIVRFFKQYIKKAYSPGLERIKIDFRTTVKKRDHRGDFVKLLNSAFAEYDRPWLLTVSRGLQAGIAGVAVYGVMIGNSIIAGWSLFSLMVTLFPDIISRDREQDFSTLYYFWISLVLFLYSFGRPIGFYGLFDLWPEITHFLSGSIVAMLVFFVLIQLTKVSETLYIQSWIIPLLVVIFMFPVGAVWEIGEFFFDLSFGTSLQASLDDTVADLISNVFGALFSMGIAYRFFPDWIWDPSENIEDL
ncbi:MAG: hypothetical protein ACOCTR_03535 [Candidatus Natronoplasma sp.]